MFDVSFAGPGLGLGTAGLDYKALYGLWGGNVP